jgi:hypothetical protein
VKKVVVEIDGGYDYTEVTDTTFDGDDDVEIDEDCFAKIAIKAARSYVVDYDKWGSSDDGTFYQGIEGSVTFNIPFRTAALEANVRVKTISFQ